MPGRARRRFASGTTGVVSAHGPDDGRSKSADDAAHARRAGTDTGGAGRDWSWARRPAPASRGRCLAARVRAASASKAPARIRRPGTALRAGESKDRLAVPGLQPPGGEDRRAPGSGQCAGHSNGAYDGAAAGAGQNGTGPAAGVWAGSCEGGHPRPSLVACAPGRPRTRPAGAGVMAPLRKLPAHHLRRAGRAAAGSTASVQAQPRSARWCCCPGWSLGFPGAGGVHAGLRTRRQGQWRGGARAGRRRSGRPRPSGRRLLVWP